MRVKLDGRYAAKRPDGLGDGLFTGWNPQKLALLEYDVVEMSSLMSELVSEGAFANIAQLFLFEEAETETRFVFINTHLYWAPGYDTLRKNQVALILTACKEKYSDLPFVLCGDLNSDPDSECCRFLRGLGCASACTSLPFTVCTLDIFTDTLDHIWIYPASMVHAEECMLIDSEAAVSIEEGGIPSAEHPSDHLPIGAKITFRRP
jgi:mRNA deadenylase 3'-5' endonuclease subunit Ccr4